MHAMSPPVAGPVTEVVVPIGAASHAAGHPMDWAGWRRGGRAGSLRGGAGAAVALDGEGSSLPGTRRPGSGGQIEWPTS